MDGIIWIIIIVGIVFSIVQFIDMFSSRIKRREKAIWFILFLMFSIITALAWYFGKVDRR